MYVLKLILTSQPLSDNSESPPILPSALKTLSPCCKGKGVIFQRRKCLRK